MSVVSAFGSVGGNGGGFTSGTDDFQNNNNTRTSMIMTATANSINNNQQTMTLPDILEGITKSEHFPPVRHRWNTNEEIAALLIALDKHEQWLSQEVKIR